MKVPVVVDSPVRLTCELVDISVLGLRVDRTLPCLHGTKVTFRLQLPDYGESPEASELELVAETVTIADDHTGLRFVDLSPFEAREVRDLVYAHQRRLLAGPFRLTLDRRIRGRRE